MQTNVEISKEGDWEALLRAEEDWIKNTVDEILAVRRRAQDRHTCVLCVCGWMWICEWVGGCVGMRVSTRSSR